MKKHFRFNEFEVSLKGEGKVRVFTNDMSKQDLAKGLQEYFEGKRFNKVSLLFESEDMVNKYYSVLLRMHDSKFRNINTKLLPKSHIIEIVKKHGCATLFTTNEHVQIDSYGSAYAESNNFTIIKVKDITH